MIDLSKGDTALIISECDARGVLRNQCAYVLATTYWETARTMKPVREYGGEKYLKSKKYYPYVGMGYVQLTWKANYKRASDELGVDFLAHPKLLLEPQHAVKILVIGMIEGWFTGKKLSDYITLQKSNFKQARRIINGTDKWNEIAAIAEDYDRLLIDAGYGMTGDGTKVIPPAYPRPKPVVERPPGPPPGAPPPTNTQSYWSKIAALFGQLFHFWRSK